MSDSRSISGSVAVDQSSAEMAALNLMKHIGQYETDQKQDRKYWLTLYKQCHKSTRGNTLEDIMKLS